MVRDEREYDDDASLDYLDLTCCGRAGCCPPFLRNIQVTAPLFGCVCQQITVSTVFWLTTVLALVLLFYLCLYIQLGEIILPGGPIFGLLLVIVFAYILGWCLAYLPYLNLPPVFGMLLAGIIARNTGWYNISKELGMRVSSQIRNFSVTFVLLRAGLQLTSSGIRNHPLFVLNLAIIPCSAELIVVAILCHVLLGYPWTWAFLCGSIVACMSPVVPVNCMLALADQGYGEDKEIASLLFAAVSIDDIHVISVYAICYTFVFSHDSDWPESWVTYVPAGVRDLIIGSVVGGIMGFFFIFFPHRAMDYAVAYRVGGLVLGSLAMTTGASSITITGGGFLAVIIMSFIATTGWKLLTMPLDMSELRNSVSVMWHWMQPVLVGVIGAEIDLTNWSSMRLGYYSAILSLGILFRMMLAFILATIHTPFSKKERLFIALSWISKGTLQAALGPMTLEQALSDHDDEEIFYANDIEKIAVLAIMILAPLGSIVMMSSGPHLLKKDTEEDQRRRRELSFMKIQSLQPVHRRSTVNRLR